MTIFTKGKGFTNYIKCIIVTYKHLTQKEQNMSRKIKYTVNQIKESLDLDLNEIFYKKNIISFMIKVTKENILDNLNKEKLLTDRINDIIINS